MLNLTQEELINIAHKKYRLKIGLRHLQNAEASKEIGLDTLNSLAYIFDRESAEISPDIKTNIHNIAEDPCKKPGNDTFGLLDVRKVAGKINLKAFADSIKRDRTFQTESTYLQRIDFHDQVIQAIKKSRWYPARQRDKKVGIWLTDPINISIN